MNLELTALKDKKAVFQSIAEKLKEHNFEVIKQDQTRPWGGFFVIEERESEKFINIYFPHLSKEELNISGKLSPKILVVAPDKRLSWQYHHRRAEIWKLVTGKAGVVVSDTDVEKDTRNLKIGDIINLKQGERHRLVGLDDWGIVAEIWRHTDSGNPSDEDDIVRIQDDFGR